MSVSAPRSWLLGEGGGWDLLLSFTFWIFVVIGPISRPLTLLALLQLPMTLRTAQALHVVSRYLSWYYALEVMLLAVPLIAGGMGPVSETMVTEYIFPPCKEINAYYGTDRCFAIDLAVTWTSGYTLCIVAAVLFYVSGVDGSFTHRYIESKIGAGRPGAEVEGGARNGSPAQARDGSPRAAAAAACRGAQAPPP